MLRSRSVAQGNLKLLKGQRSRRKCRVSIILKRRRSVSYMVKKSKLSEQAFICHRIYFLRYKNAAASALKFCASQFLKQEVPLRSCNIASSRNLLNSHA